MSGWLGHKGHEELCALVGRRSIDVMEGLGTNDTAGSVYG